MDNPSLCLDSSGTLRGQCTKCRECPSWSSSSGKKIRFKPEEANAMDERRGCKPAQCEHCGCPASVHESLDGWLHCTRHWVQRLCCSDGAWPERAPPTGVLPLEAKSWAPEDAALHVVTGGQFEPGRDGRGASPQAGGEENLVSVVCTTLEKDHASHNLLYECFRRQTYEPRELIVVDSGTAPSPVLTEKAQEDSRVTYRFFFREEHGLEQAEDPYERVLKRDDPNDIIEWTYYVEEMPDNDRAEVRWEGLSLGLKRNIACHLAHGSAIMHFNVNAFYAPSYLTVMQRELAGDVAQQARRRGASGGGPSRLPAAVCLATWHTLDMDDEEFRLVDTERRGSEVAESKRQQVQYGKGLTYTYTRSCWELAPFPDVEEPEGRLAKVLKQASIPFRFVQSPTSEGALAAHGYLKESSSGESASASINLSLEIRVLETCSASVALPKVFVELMPLSREIVAGIKLKQGGGMNALLQAEGACFFCIHCDAAIALRRYLKTIKKLGDGSGGKVEIAQFSRAGGAVAEGAEATYEEPPKRQVQRPTFGPPSASFGNRGQSLRGGAALPAYGGFSFNRPLAGKPQVGAGRPTMGIGGMNGIGGGLMVFGRGQAMGAQRATGFQNHQAQARAAQARALGQPFPLVPPRTGFAGAARYAPEPDPTDAAWFPGWWRRNAACRHCGNNIGWRYENEEKTIFWVLETQFLREREPEPQESPVLTQVTKMPAYANPVPPQTSGGYPPQPTVSAPAVPKVEQKEPVESPPLLTPSKPKEEEPKVELKKEEPKEATESKEAESKEQKPAEVAAQKVDVHVEKSTDKSPDAARQAIRAFSPELKEHLALGISSPQRAKFDQALNEMKLDGTTRQNLLKELKVRPGVAATQVEHLVAKSFKGKINSLRSLGLRVLRTALQEELPLGAALDRLVEAVKKDAGANDQRSGKDVGKEQDHDKPPVTPSKKDKVPLAEPRGKADSQGERREAAEDTPAPKLQAQAEKQHAPAASEGQKVEKNGEEPAVPEEKPTEDGVETETLTQSADTQKAEARSEMPMAVTEEKSVRAELRPQTVAQSALATSDTRTEAQNEVPVAVPEEKPAQAKPEAPPERVPLADVEHTSLAKAPKANVAPQAPAQPGPPAEKSIETGRQAIRGFSPALQEHLALSVCAPDKAKFDATLNEMKLDDATRKNILVELRVRPGVAATQVEHLVAKNFKGKINTLRSLGLRVLRASLERELPCEAMERLAAGATKDTESGTRDNAEAGHREERPQPVPETNKGTDHHSGPLPVPEGWEAEWSEPCQCWKYYNEYGQMHHEPPPVEELN